MDRLDALIAALVPGPLIARDAALQVAEPRKSEHFRARELLRADFAAMPPQGPPDALAWSLALAAQLSICFGETKLGSVLGRWELLVPVLGPDGARDVLTALGARGVQSVSKAQLERWLDAGDLPTLKASIRRGLRYYPVVIDDREDAAAMGRRLAAWFDGGELR